MANYYELLEYFHLQAETNKMKNLASKAVDKLIDTFAKERVIIGGMWK